MKNILIVDDEAVQIKSLRLGLRSEWFSVTAALNAEEAVQYLEREPDGVDVIVSDYIMPGRDGLQLFEAVRRMDRQGPFIIMTACTRKDTAVKVEKSGCDGFIEKPFTISELRAEIDRVQQDKTAMNWLSHAWE